MIRGVLSTMGKFFGQSAANLTNFTGYGSGMFSVMRGIKAAQPGGIKSMGSAANDLFLKKALPEQQRVFINARKTQAIDAAGMSILGMGNHGAQNFGGHLRHGVMDWVSGMNYRDQVTSAMNRGGANLAMDTLGMRRRMMTRMAVPGLVGAGMLSSSLLGEDSLISRGARLGVGLGVHGAIGTGLAFGARPAVGAGYMGLAAWNAVRPGNNFGPF